MRIITALSSTLDAYSESVGKLLAWLLPLLMINTCLVVFLRYGLEQGSTYLQELSTYLHATVFMLGAGYTLKRDAHVRVDVFYRRFSARRQAWVNAIGTLVFLLPLCGYVLISSWEFVYHAWLIGRARRDSRCLSVESAGATDGRQSGTAGGVGVLQVTRDAVGRLCSCLR